MESTYAKAYTEVLEILKYIPVEEYLKIPQEKILEFEKNKDNDYSFIYDKRLSLEKQNVLKETKVIIVSLFRDYFATSAQKAKLEKILMYNEEILDGYNREKYSYDNIFKTNNKVENSNVKAELPVVKKEGFFTKIWRKLKGLFVGKD